MLHLRVAALVLVGSTATLILSRCTPTPEATPARQSASAVPPGDKPDAGSSGYDAGSSGYLDITPTPPKELARPASMVDTAKFAWQELLALSWKSSWDKDQKRGTPDLSWSYATPGSSSGELLVWQTYAQTTELRPNTPLTTPWDSLGTPKYSYANPPLKGSPGAVDNLWNNLDEDNEIGSCDVVGQYSPDAGPIAQQKLVLYQVKVNKDEYEYVRINFGADQNVGDKVDGGAAECTADGGAHSTLCGAQLSVQANIVKGPPHTYYPGATTTCVCPPAQAICLPCGGSPTGSGGTLEGAIEVKSAWRMLGPNDDPSRFYTTNALYYEVATAPADKGKLVYKNGVFGLIGIHIIHKTVNYPDFVFATWEQVDVESAHENYVLLNTNGAQVGGAVPIERQKGQSNRKENHPVPPDLDTVTTAVHAQLTGLNKSTIWQYYRLTGVQGAAVDCPTDAGGPPLPSTCVAGQDPVACAKLDPNYFMANFSIESDPFLNNFSGPGFGGAPFKTCENLVYQGNTYDMGGCKGCHGVAQTAFGTDLSFLLDYGANKPSINPATLYYQQPSSPTKVKKPFLTELAAANAGRRH
jgi:hypothetical protein